ncbi:MAG: CNNM domain-containing protein, partial [Candidatus Methylomirabilaceae bacterium]
MEGLAPGTLLFEITLILLLILINGFFAASEVALISLRRSRAQELADGGDGRALTIQRVKDDPDRFLATVQIGITLVGTLAAAVGGVVSVRAIRPMLDRLPGGGLRGAAEPVALALVVLAITYLSVVFGELVPKSLALRHAERIALATARPLNLLTRWFSLLARPLTASSRVILSLLGVP